MKHISAYKRKKEPEKVRKALVDAGIAIAAKSGIESVTLSAVSKAAGVTKGGLFHHFENKDALVAEMFSSIMNTIDSLVELYLENDRGTFGCFTRAYIEVSFSAKKNDKKVWDSMCSSLSAAQANRIFANWRSKRIRKHAKTDAHTILEIVRLAADGAWYAMPSNLSEVKKLKQSLINMTYKD